MNKLSKEKKQQLVMVAIGTLGLVATIYFLLISAQLDVISKRKLETEETQKKVEMAEKLVKKAPEVDKEAAVRSKQLGQIENQMASGDLKIWILNTLKLVNDEHPLVKISNISTDASVPVGILPVFPYSAVRFEVRGSGYYHDLGKFFTDFENSLPYFRIQNLDLESGAGDLTVIEDREKLAFKADFVVLLKPELAEAPGPKPK